MKGWYTARELAALALPGLPQSKRRINEFAHKEGWKQKKTLRGDPLARPCGGREGGGGIEYHHSLLPQAARLALQVQALKQPAAQPVQTLPQPAQPATAPRIVRRDAALTLLALADGHFNNNRALGRITADADFAAQWNRGDIESDVWLRRELPTVSARSIRRWREVRDEGRWNEVGGSGRKIRHALDVAEEGAVATHIGALLLKQPFLVAGQLRDLVEAQFGRQLKLRDGFIALPSLRSFQQWIAWWKEANKAIILQHTNPDVFKSRARASGINAYAGIGRVNELWELDASPADVLLRGGRHAVYLITDVFSRRMMLQVTKTARAEAALGLLRRAIMAWGVPDTLRTDNGSDFKAEAFTRALVAVGIRQDVTKPYTPEAKAIVERAIGTFQHMVGPLLPGFIGHNVTERKQIEERKSFAQRLGETDEHAFCVDLDKNDFQAICNDWAAVKYGNRIHRSLGMSPNEKARSCLSPIRAIQNAQALSLLLTPVPGGWRQVTKRGLQFEGGYYLAGALLAGQRVFCRMDAEDMGRLFVFDDEFGAFICEAVCPERAGANPHAVLAATKAAQKQLLKDGLKEAKAEARRLKPRHMIDSVLRLAAEKAAADGENVTLFPKQETSHVSAGLSSAADALDARASLSTPPSTAVDSRVESNVHRLPETSEARFRRFRAIERAMAAGADVDAGDALKLGNYQKTPEYLSMLAMERDFGGESNEVS